MRCLNEQRQLPTCEVKRQLDLIDHFKRVINDSISADSNHHHEMSLFKKKIKKLSPKKIRVLIFRVARQKHDIWAKQGDKSIWAAPSKYTTIHIEHFNT